MHSNRPPATLASLILLLWSAMCFAQSTIRIPADRPTIQDGIDAAQNGDTVLVAPGTYNENIDFKGKAVTVTSGAKSFADAASTVINGSQDGPVVVFQTGETADAVLNGFTIQNGHASVASQARGGGLFINNASPTILNNIVARNFGCGVFVVNLASPLIQGNDIRQTLYPPSRKNDALCHSASAGAGSGIGLFLSNIGDVRMIGNVIEDNVTDPAGDSGNPIGAGVLVTSPGRSLLLQENVIRNNHTYGNAGLAIAGTGPVNKLVLVNNLFYGNEGREQFYPTQILIFGFSGTSSVGPNPTVTKINNTIYGRGQEMLYSFGPLNYCEQCVREQYALRAFEPTRGRLVVRSSRANFAN